MKRYTLFSCLLASTALLAMDNDVAMKTLAHAGETSGSLEKEYQLLEAIDDSIVPELKEGALDAIRALIKDGVNINFQYPAKSNITPLMLSIKQANYVVMHLLLSTKGLDIRIKDARGWEAIHYCITRGQDTQALKLLLEHRTSLSPALALNAVTQNGSTVLNFAAEQGNLDHLELLCKEADVNPNIPDTSCEIGNFPLHQAVKGAHETGLLMIRLLADKGALMNALNAEDQTPLTMALERRDNQLHAAPNNSSLNVALALLALGASATPAQIEYLKNNPRLLGIEGDTEIVIYKSLLEVCIYAAATTLPKSRIPGFVADLLSFWFQSTDVILTKTYGSLKKLAVDPNMKDGTYGMTPLMWAAARGHLELAKLLLMHPKIDVNATDNFGETALHYAARNGHLALVIYLLQHTGIFANQKNNKGKTPLDLARLRNHDNICAVLEFRTKIMLRYLMSVGSLDTNSRLSALPKDIALLIYNQLGEPSVPERRGTV